MKKIKLASAIVAMSLFGMAQDPWKTDLNDFPPGQEPRFGTQSNQPLNFFTNGTQKMSLSPDGVLKLNALTGTVGEASRPLYVNSYGEIQAAPEVPTTYNCSSIVPWYGGGNKNMGYRNTIGTCDPQDFLLKANDVPLLFIKSVTNPADPYLIGVGPGNSSPGALMDISDGHTNSFDVNRMRLYGDADGTIEAYTTPMNLISHGGFYFQDGVKGNSNITFMVDGSGNATMANATMGNATMGNATMLTVNMGNATMANATMANATMNNATATGKIKVNVPSSNALALEVYDVSSGKTNFKVLSGGQTRIGDQAGSPDAALLNVNVNGSANAIAVWDKASGGGSGAHNFLVKNNGYTYCRELEVMTGTFPDYVFDKSYKLKTLGETEAYINANKHLPGFESAEYYIKNGIKTSEMFVRQQEKIEELTLYIIALEKRLNSLENK